MILKKTIVCYIHFNLTLFVHCFHRSACRKIVNIIKKELLKAKDAKLRHGNIGTVSDSLQEQITLVINQSEKINMTSPDKVGVAGFNFFLLK